jgi:hypothetical protein
VEPGEPLIHLLCDCGALVSLAPPAGARSVSCRACSRVLEVPDPASVGWEPPSPGEPAPVRPAAPAPAAPPPPPHRPVPVFATDERLDTRSLEREAARQGALGRVVLVGGILAAAAGGLLLDAPPAARAALAAGLLFVAVAAWALFRAARASCLAAVALAQRQAEIVRSLERP